MIARKIIIAMCLPILLTGQSRPARDLGLVIGILKTGANNAITDVAGVRVGHYTLIQGDNIRTGVTAILPHGGNIFQDKVPAAIFIGNGFGKLAGYSQVEELGNLETPIILTNTLNVAEAVAAAVEYTLGLPGNEGVQSVNALVGETNDGLLNDIRGRHLRPEHFLQAIRNAAAGPVPQGNVGAGTGTVCFGFKGGIGTASRVLPAVLGGYTVGVLVQTNFNGVLTIAGVPVGVELGQYPFAEAIAKGEGGSCMIVVATDAPLTARNLKRLALRALFGLARTGGIAANGSGDYVIAFSTAASVRINQQSEALLDSYSEVRNDRLSPLFLAVNEASEEAILNSLFCAESMKGWNGNFVAALPRDKVVAILKKHGRINP
jgi:D-aminopeptidase